MKEFKVMRKRRRRNRKNAWLLVLITVCAVLFVFAVCVLCFEFLSGEDVKTPVPTEPCVIENEKTSTLILKTGDKQILTVDADSETINTLEFTSSDTKVLTVDSGGRVDALKEGVATVSVTGNNYSGECVITVNKAPAKQPVTEYTTAYIANQDIVEENKKNTKKSLYRVTVNRRTNTVTVYTYDSNGEYVVPVRAMVCSCGENNEKNITITGTFAVYFKSRWHSLFGDVYGQYITGFSGNYLFHSVPYLNTSSDKLKTEEFNKLGTNASQGCVRMMISDAKWIYDNLEIDTVVEVVDKSSKYDPLGTPPTIKLEPDAKWDPTDPEKGNPYSKKEPVISGAEDVTLNVGDNYDVKVTAKDTCSQDISDKIVVTGNVITSKKGEYLVTYSVTDALNKKTEKTVTVTVK